MSAFQSIAFLSIISIHPIYSLSCNEVTNNKDISNLEWSFLKTCLSEIARSNIDKETAENIWNLIKEANYGLENIEPEVYQKIGNILTAIPMEDLKNITFGQFEMVEAFGIEHIQFSEEQMKIIADRIQSDWSGKNARTFSQYDLIALGPILCYFNKSDVERIYADAYKKAAEKIGKLEKCPQDKLQALAGLATQGKAFGPPGTWTKIEIYIIGNVVNGLSKEDSAKIQPSALKWNKQTQNASDLAKNTNSSNKN